MVSSVELSLQVIASCDYTSFQDWSLEGTTLQTSVKGDAVTSQLNGLVYDTVSQAMGDKDGLSFCGGRNYNLIDWSSQFSAGTTLTINTETDTLVLESTSDADIGKFDVQIEISLQEYP